MCTHQVVVKYLYYGVLDEERVSYQVDLLNPTTEPYM
jgi:hypothetical protein